MAFVTLKFMVNFMRLYAYAKVNFHLAVDSPDASGYHPIQSIFAMVDLCDVLDCSAGPGAAFSIAVTGLEQVCSSNEDSISKAALLWYEASGVPLEVSVDCQKRIPVKAGLGGGSSDAAAILHYLQMQAGDRALEEKALLSVAKRTGSDVPFFLAARPCALVRSYGGDVVPVEPKKGWALLVMPLSFDSPTESAYRNLDAARSRRDMEGFSLPAEVLRVLARDFVHWKGRLHNDFSGCIGHGEFYDGLADLADGFEGYGSLSGSGACWFFVAGNRETVRDLGVAVADRFGSDVRTWLVRLVA